MPDSFCKPVPDERLIGDGLHGGKLLDRGDLKRIDLDRNVFQIPFPFAGKDFLLNMNSIPTRMGASPRSLTIPGNSFQMTL